MHKSEDMKALWGNNFHGHGMLRLNCYYVSKKSFILFIPSSFPRVVINRKQVLESASKTDIWNLSAQQQFQTLETLFSLLLPPEFLVTFFLESP